MNEQHDFKAIPTVEKRREIRHVFYFFIQTLAKRSFFLALYFILFILVFAPFLQSSFITYVNGVYILVYN